MPQPTYSQIHVNVPLTFMSIAYIQAAEGFIADKVFPLVPVDKQSDRYYTYNKNDFMRDEAQERAPGTESAGGGYNLDNTPSYYCTIWAFHKDVAWYLRANADAVLDMDRDASIFITQRMLISRERQWVKAYFQPGVWGTTVQGVASGNVPGASFIQWSDYMNSDPITDIRVGRMMVKQQTGFLPNVLTMSEYVFEVLSNHPDIVDRYKYTTNSVITEEMLAKLFRVDQLVVAGAVYASNEEGQTAQYQFISSNHALLSNAPKSAGILQPSAGYVFAWRGLTGNMVDRQSAGYALAIDKFPIRRLKVDRVEGEMAYCCKQTGSDLGYFFENAAA